MQVLVSKDPEDFPLKEQFFIALFPFVLDYHGSACERLLY
jgi:hypothetical protein